MAVLVAIACVPCAALGSTLHEALARNYGRESIVILYPGDQTTVFGDSGRIEVYVMVSPWAQMRPGDRIELFHNGRMIIGSEHQFVLENAGHGTHLLRARLVNSDGAVRAYSRTVAFTMWRTQLLSASK